MRGWSSEARTVTLGVEHLRRVPLAGPNEDVAPRDQVVANSREVHGYSVAGPDLGSLGVQALQRSHANFMAGGQEGQSVVHADLTAGEGARDDRARTLGGKHSVDPKPGPLAVDRGGCRSEQFVNGDGHVVHANTVDRIDREDGSALQKGARCLLGDIEPGELDEIVVGLAHLGERDETVFETQQVEDAEVLLGLRLPALGGRNNEDASVHRPHAGQHVLEEPHVAGNVYERHPAARRQGSGRKAEVNGQSPFFLLGQPVGVGAGQGAYEGALTVVDVAGGGDDVHQPGPLVDEAAQSVGHLGVVGRIDCAQVDQCRLVDNASDDRPWSVAKGRDLIALH